MSPSLAQCQLTYKEREPIDLRLAREQHGRYEEALVAAGCWVRPLKSLPDLPDAVFVEDMAVVLDEIAVIARCGAASRRMEASSVAGVLEGYRQITYIDPPGTLDGGDVLRVGARLYVGQSTRTNDAGAEMMESIAARHGYEVHRIRIGSCLHLKSAVTAVDLDTVLLNPEWVDPGSFEGLAVVEVDPQEPEAANALHLGDVIIYADRFPRTRQRLEERGIRVLTVDLSELAKAEGAVTCCSIIVDTVRAASIAA